MTVSLSINRNVIDITIYVFNSTKFSKDFYKLKIPEDKTLQTRGYKEEKKKRSEACSVYTMNSVMVITRKEY